MRERRMWREALPCDTNLYADGPKSIAETKAQGPQHCPYWDKCMAPGFQMAKGGGHTCIMRNAAEVMKYVARGANLKAELAEFRRDAPRPPQGWVWSADRKDFIIITDPEDAFHKMEEFTHTIMDDSDCSKHGTDTVRPDFDDVVAYATTEDGAIDTRRLDELEGRFGYNGGRGCDVRSGPCSCGAWH